MPSTEQRSEQHDRDETEMSGYHDSGRLSQESQARLNNDMERQSEARPADTDKSAAYRKLYGIVVVMTMLMFGLNIEQVCLLPVISNLYWIVLFPGVIFIAFMAWAFLSVTSNRSVFFGQLGSVGEGSNRAFQHLKALFVLQGRSQRSYAYDNSAPSWPRRFARAGVFLTIFLNIIFCQFIYLPIFAVPAFNEITWKIGLNASTNVTTPSFAIIQNTQLARRATLEEDTTSLQQLCDQKMNNPVFDNQWCFQEPKNFTYVDEQQHEHQVRYVTFDGNLYPTIDMDEHLSLWYQYKYNGSASQDPVLALAAFDTALINDFKHALECGIITSTSFPAGDRNHASLHQVRIDDTYGAMDHPEHCQDFKQYNTYEADIIALGAPSAPGSNDCDLSSENFNGSCDADVTVSFPSTLTRVYTSQHGKDWITILTEEGGVVGFVTFLTWFFGIFTV